MKNFLLVLFGLLPLPMLLHAQNQPAKTTIDPRIYTAYEREYVDRVAQSNPFLIQYWTFYLENAYFITDMPSEKTDDAMEYTTIKIDNLNNINILQLEKKYPMKHDWDTLKAYRIEGTSKLLVYHPGRLFVEKLNAYRKNLN
jgi:GT2 family glycosyltransferase